jgi:hypothetical protein
MSFSRVETWTFSEFAIADLDCRDKGLEHYLISPPGFGQKPH